jgi:hypothetical protein|tara:strand:- start:557 stop:1543 length:987 start_codon:yes stop_codon:yes gene_type:complete
MAYSANFNTSYEIKNYPELIPLIEKSKEAISENSKFISQLDESCHRNTFDVNHQILKEGKTIKRTIGELCESYKYETTVQQIDPKAVQEILFGSDGLIKKKGGGRFPYLMEDIEVAMVKSGVFQDEGPIISSGRNRLLALQILLKAAGAPEEKIANCEVRVDQVKLGSHEELQRRIISANTGSRTFSRSEIREREGARGGVVFLSKEKIKSTIVNAINQKSFSAALGAYLKLSAAEIGDSTLTSAQYSAAGTNLWGKLCKDFRPNGGTFYSYVKGNTKHFCSIAEMIETLLPMAIEKVKEDVSAGQKSGKLARALFDPLSSWLRTQIG